MNVTQVIRLSRPDMITQTTSKAATENCRCE